MSQVEVIKMKPGKRAGSNNDDKKKSLKEIDALEATGFADNNEMFMSVDYDDRPPKLGSGEPNPGALWPEGGASSRLLRYFCH